MLRQAASSASAAAPMANITRFGGIRSSTAGVRIEGEEISSTQSSGATAVSRSGEAKSACQAALGSAADSSMRKVSAAQ